MTIGCNQHHVSISLAVARKASRPLPPHITNALHPKPTISSSPTPQPLLNEASSLLATVFFRIKTSFLFLANCAARRLSSLSLSSSSISHRTTAFSLPFNMRSSRFNAQCRSYSSVSRWIAAISCPTCCIKSAIGKIMGSF
jgi:hypothetical protein